MFQGSKSITNRLICKAEKNPKGRKKKSNFKKSNQNSFLKKSINKSIKNSTEHDYHLIKNMMVTKLENPKTHLCKIRGEKEP